MPRRLTLFSSVAALVLLSAGAPLRAQQAGAGQAPAPVFKAGTAVVPVYVTVTDSTKRLVPDLVKEDFTILDNGKPVQILLFDTEIQPITVAVMLDTSGSMTSSIDLLKAAAEQFLIRLLPADKGRVGAFNDKIEFTSEFTSDRDSLIGALRDIDFGNPTRLWDAVDVSIDELKPFEGRKVVLVFTDGEDTASKVGMGRVLDRARVEEVMIYAIGLQSEFFNGAQRIRTRPDRQLKRLAEDTGGGYFELKSTDELGPTFTRVAQELHSQYSLAFAPATDGKVHKLELTLNKPGLTGRARKSYQAPAAGTQ
jgi:Ca-activated chloride channel family protein